MDIAAQISLTREEMEGRRLEAARELLNGLSQSKVARKFGVSRTTASRWYRSLAGKGVDSLKRRKATGRPSRLSSDQLNRLAQIYREPPAAYGYADERWTTARLAAVIETRFGVRYDHDHVGRLMQKLGLREPKRRANAVGFAAKSYAPTPFPTDSISGQPYISPTVA